MYPWNHGKPRNTASMSYPCRHGAPRVFRQEPQNPTAIPGRSVKSAILEPEARCRRTRRRHEAGAGTVNLLCRLRFGCPILSDVHGQDPCAFPRYPGGPVHAVSVFTGVPGRFRVSGRGIRGRVPETVKNPQFANTKRNPRNRNDATGACTSSTKPLYCIHLRGRKRFNPQCHP